MRRVILFSALIATLVVVDALANDFRFTSGFYAEVEEFTRLFIRFARHSLGSLD